MTEEQEVTFSEADKEELKDFSEYVYSFKPVDLMQLKDMLDVYYLEYISDIDNPERKYVSFSKFQMILSANVDMVMKYFGFLPQIVEMLKERKKEKESEQLV